MTKKGPHEQVALELHESFDAAWRRPIIGMVMVLPAIFLMSVSVTAFALLLNKTWLEIVEWT